VGTTRNVTSLRPALRPGAVVPGAVRVLGDEDYAALRAVVDAEPLVNAVFAARLDAVRTLEPRRLGGTVLALHAEGRIQAAVFAGGTLLPLGGSREACVRLASALARQSRICSSIVGARSAVAAMETVLLREWGEARAIRPSQPLLIATRDIRGSLPTAHPGLRCAAPTEFAQYLTASIAMFEEELGASPLTRGGAVAYRRRVRELMDAGRAFTVTDADGEVVFKADLGAVTAQTCQVQGVWVRADHRGRGLATAALAGVLRHALTLAPSVSLYVNDFNLPARRLYARLGMRQVEELRTVLF
jgi:predicted GNAT family acetyltransferase